MTPITNFISEVKSAGLAVSNRYTVDFTPPKSLFGTGFNDTYFQQKMLMFCSQVQLPGINLSSSQSRTFGEVREMPYERLFDNFSLTFYVDSEMKIKYFWDSWVNSIQDSTTRAFEFYKNYITDMTVVVEDKNENATYEVKLYEVYPKTIAPIQLSYDQKEVMQVQVTLNYRYWESQLVGNKIYSSIDQADFRPDQTELQRIMKNSQERKGFDLRNYVPPFLKNII